MELKDKISILPELTISEHVVAPTTTVSMLAATTAVNGSGWYEQSLASDDETTFYHVDGKDWQYNLNGTGRWFGNYKPADQLEAQAYYNLPLQNPATHLYEFRFAIPKKDVLFCIFGSAEAKVGHWQAKFPNALIPYVNVISVIELSEGINSEQNRSS